MNMSDAPEFAPACPIPIQRYPRILMAHGGGGKLMHDLISQVFVAAFGAGSLQVHRDSATLETLHHPLAFTTDSYVVQPLIFPGGDIGSMSVHGTVNDLAMSGARPLYISAGFILEEGLPMETLWTIVQSMRRAAEQTGVRIVTGDTKVVEKGKGDGIFINTSGIGAIENGQSIGPHSVRSEDAIIVSGDLGRHGMAILAAREGLQFQSSITSDSAPVAELVIRLLEAGIEIHCLRDLTRGGLASALNEIAGACGKNLLINESEIPIREDVRGACEIYGLDPLHVACEGRFVAFVSALDANKAQEIMRAHPVSANARLIGEVSNTSNPRVTLRSSIGTRRILEVPSGEQLPRIC